MMSQHIGKPFATHHIDRALHMRAIPDRCFKAHARSPCAGEVLKYMRRMAAGGNCSYTNSSGVPVQLICGAAECCNANNHTCSVSACSATEASASTGGTSLNTYLFWVILASSTICTVVALLASYAICRYRKPGCADADAARERFVREHILDASMLTRHGTELQGAFPSTLQPVSNTDTTTITSTTITTLTDITSTTSATGHSTPCHDSLMLVHQPIEVKRVPPKPSKIPVKKPPTNVYVGTEAVTRASIAVTVGTRARAVVPPLQQPGRVIVSSSLGAHSNRVQSRRGPSQPAGACVRRGGGGSQRGLAVVTPRVITLKEKGKTSSRQTIVSEDVDHTLTTVGT